MLVFQRSEAGTIREQNQDVLVTRDEHGIFIMADGGGANGRQLAQRTADRLVVELMRLRTYPSSDYADTAFRRLMRTTLEDLRHQRLSHPENVAATVSLGVSLIHEGRLHLATTGSIGALAFLDGQTRLLEPQGIPPLYSVLEDDRLNGILFTASSDKSPEVDNAMMTAVSHAPDQDLSFRHLGHDFVRVGDWVLFCSPGLLISQPLDEIVPVAPAIHEDAEGITEALFRRASGRYDGDDRSLALLRFLPTDLQRRFPPERVVSVDFDRRWRAPLWVPLAALSAIGLVALWLKKRFRVLWSNDGE